MQECWKCSTDCGITQLVLIDVDCLLHLDDGGRASIFPSYLCPHTSSAGRRE